MSDQRIQPVKKGQRLSAEWLNRVGAGAVQRLNAADSNVRRVGNTVTIAANPKPTPWPIFLARITAWRLMTGSTARWWYDWERIRLHPNTDRMEIAVGTGHYEASGTYADGSAAVNLCELSNGAQGSGTLGNSIDSTGSAYPSSFTLQPVGGGTGGVPAIEVPVRIWYEFDDTGAKIPVFYYINADDGACPT